MNQIGATVLVLPSARLVATSSCFALLSASRTSGANCALAAAVPSTTSATATTVHIRHLRPGIALGDRSQAAGRESTRSGGEAELHLGACYGSRGDPPRALRQGGRHRPEEPSNLAQTAPPPAASRGAGAGARRRGARTGAPAPDRRAGPRDAGRGGDRHGRS